MLCCKKDAKVKAIYSMFDWSKHWRSVPGKIDNLLKIISASPLLIICKLFSACPRLKTLLGISFSQQPAAIYFQFRNNVVTFSDWKLRLKHIRCHYTTNAIYVHSVVIEELCKADIKSLIDTLSISSFIFSMSQQKRRNYCNSCLCFKFNSICYKSEVSFPKAEWN